jgi:PAS domain S-box-containing protein
MMNEKLSEEFNRSISQTLLKNHPDIIVILDRQGKIIQVSDNIVKTFNDYNKNELIGKSLAEFMVEKDKEVFVKQLKEITEKKTLKMQEYKFLKKDRSKIAGELSLSIIESEIGNDILLGIMRDISNQKSLEKDLVKSKQMFQLVMDNIPQLLSWKDINSIYIGCNKNFARVAGINDPAEIIGKSDYELPWKISEAESFFEIDQLVMDTDKPEYHIIEPQLQADGKQAWLDTNKIPLHNSKGEVVGILCTYEDITDRVNAEIALKNSEKKYREAFNRAEFYKDVFAHDISNILQGILSSLELSRLTLKDVELNQIDKFYEIIEDQINRGANLVSNIRKISSIDDNDKKLLSIEVLSYIKEAIEVIRKLFSKREITFQLTAPQEQIYVKANELLFDVFQNILYNAVKHNKNSPVDIDVIVNDEVIEGTTYVKLQFVDNGLGIPDPQKTTIFQRGTVESKSFNRLGLGLSLVKKLVETYNGQIWVEDKVKGDPTKGTNFIILIEQSNM